MPLNHLTDEEIQDCLDGNLSPENAILVQEHLEACSFCQEALRRYQALYSSLGDDKGFELSPGFARSVVKKLPAEAETESHFNYLNILLTILGIIVTVGVTLTYVDFRPLGRAFSHILPRQEFGSSLLGFAIDLLAGLNGNAGFLIIVLLTLLLIVALDRFILQPKYRRITF